MLKDNSRRPFKKARRKKPFVLPTQMKHDGKQQAGELFSLV